VSISKLEKIISLAAFTAIWVLLAMYGSGPVYSDQLMYVDIGLNNIQNADYGNRYFHVYLQKLFMALAPTPLVGTRIFWGFLVALTVRHFEADYAEGENQPPQVHVAFECVLHEKLETESRYVFIGRIVRLAARAGLIDTEAWRVNLRDYRPVARFGASFYTRTNDRFSLSDSTGQRAPTSTSIDEI